MISLPSPGSGPGSSFVPPNAYFVGAGLATHAHTFPCTFASPFFVSSLPLLHSYVSSSTGAAGSTKRDPIVVGKPSDFVLTAISDTVGVPRKRMAMVGDRLDTDILFGQQGGLSTMLVLSGGIPECHCQLA